MNLTIDTSALLAVLLDEPERKAIIESTQEAQLCAPPSVPWEVGNALSALIKRKRLSLSQAEAVSAHFEMISIRWIEIDRTSALGLAAQLGIYAYDAYFLELARAQRLPLLTLDRGLKRAAKALDIRLLEIEP